jgi:hypothetical protein
MDTDLLSDRFAEVVEDCLSRFYAGVETLRELRGTSLRVIL